MTTLWTRANGKKLWGTLWLFLFALLLFPVKFEALRLTTLLVTGALWMGALILFWRQLWGRAAYLALPVLVILAFALPGRPPNVQALRSNYARSLQTYTGTRYIWGGENRLGIDCSGLVRCGLMDANFKEGLRTANPRLMRNGFALWWNDSSAMELGSGYRGRTYPLGEIHSLNEADYSRLLPGDFAVTDGGGHTLAYLGNKTWIEADPSALVGDKVITIHVPDNKNAWFEMPMRLMRWREFEL